jgi:hypothetical protein
MTPRRDFPMGGSLRDPELMTCPDCEGSGYGLGETKYSWECCGDVLPTGECCAARYGEDRLVPVPYETPTTCPRCLGYGEVELR